jgi:hypothetical protein
LIFKCPECDEGHVVMRALVWILANSGEVVGHNEWDDKSDAHCDVCNWSGSVADLSKEEEKMNLYIGSYTDAQRVTNVVTLRAASIDEATELLKADTERRLGAEITLGEPEDDERTSLTARRASTSNCPPRMFRASAA